MAELASLPLRYRVQLGLYRWRRLDPVPWTPLPRPLTRATVALVTTAGYYRPGIDPPFRRLPGGDVSFRVLPDDTPLATLELGQTSGLFDRDPALHDPNVAHPVERLRELARAGHIGRTATRHLSFNGSITAPARLVRNTAPAAAELLRGDGVDAAVLVPI